MVIPQKVPLLSVILMPHKERTLDLKTMMLRPNNISRMT